jgi:outer membrane receptor protein involved in Fe transport
MNKNKSCQTTLIGAQAFEILSLEPEKSINFSAGFTARLLDHINVTADAYWIQIKDWIILSGVLTETTNMYVVLFSCTI